VQFGIQWQEVLAQLDAAMTSGSGDFDEEVLHQKFNEIDESGDGSLDEEVRPSPLAPALQLVLPKSSSPAASPRAQLPHLAPPLKRGLPRCVRSRPRSSPSHPGGTPPLVQELARVIVSVGMSELDPTIVPNLIRLADDDGNGTIEWPEFLKIFQILHKMNSGKEKATEAVEELQAA
jgi:hypothetical protein